MIPITDPNEIDQLESSSPNGALTPVSDPNENEQLEHQNRIEQFSNARKSLFSEFPKNFAGGILNGLTGLAKSIPDLTTMTVPFSGSSVIPEGMKGAIPNQAGESPIDKFDAYKAMGTTEQPLSTLSGWEQLGGELFVPGKVAAKGIGGAYSGIKNLIESASPQKYANKLLHSLGQGAETSEQVSTSLGKDIRNAHDARVSQSTAYLKHPLERAGEELIYDRPNPLITTAVDKNKEILSRVSDLNVGDLYDAFKAKPSFQNAHNLQSELGVMIGDLKKNPYKTIAESKEIQKLNGIRETLKGDIKDFLSKRDLNSNETLAPMYQRGIDFYREHVSPYLQGKKLREITRGGKETVKNIHSIFDTPTDVINSAGEREIGHVNKIMQDLPDTAKGKILFSKIGGMRNAEDPEKLIKSLFNAKNQGYEKYIGKDLESKLLDVLNRHHNKEFIKKAGKIAGYSGAGALGIGLEELIRRNI